MGNDVHVVDVLPAIAGDTPTLGGAMRRRTVLRLMMTPFALMAACSSDAIDPGPRTIATINGKAHPVGPADLSALWAVWEPADGSPPDSVELGTDGSFRIAVTTASEQGDLRIGGPSTTSYHPFLYPFDVADLAAIDVVMIPRVWTIQRGEYAGQSVQTSLDIVVNDNASQTFYSYFQGQPFPWAAPELYFLDLMSWRTDALPAKVALDRQNSDRDLTAADSSAIWQALDRMESVFGIDLFEPIVPDTAWWPVPTGPFEGREIPGTIRITAQPPGWRAFLHFEDDGSEWEQDLGGWTAGGRFDAFRVRQRYLNGGVLVLGEFEPFRLADGLIAWQTVMMHEMLHVLGAGHTCRMESPMGPCARTAEPSRYDVAYFEILWEAIRLQREVSTPFGIMPAVIGERRLLMGLPALPEMER